MCNPRSVLSNIGQRPPRGSPPGGVRRVHGHGPDFWERAHRYPKMERAIGYLIAKSGDHDHGFDD